MKLPEKYKENLDASSEGPSSGVGYYSWVSNLTSVMSYRNRKYTLYSVSLLFYLNCDMSRVPHHIHSLNY